MDAAILYSACMSPPLQPACANPLKRPRNKRQIRLRGSRSHARAGEPRHTPSPRHISKKRSRRGGLTRKAVAWEINRARKARTRRPSRSDAHALYTATESTNAFTPSLSSIPPSPPVPVGCDTPLISARERSDSDSLTDLPPLEEISCAADWRKMAELLLCWVAVRMQPIVTAILLFCLVSIPGACAMDQLPVTAGIRGNLTVTAAAATATAAAAGAIAIVGSNVVCAGTGTGGEM